MLKLWHTFSRVSQTRFFSNFAKLRRTPASTVFRPEKYMVWRSFSCKIAPQEKLWPWITSWPLTVEQWNLVPMYRSLTYIFSSNCQTLSTTVFELSTETWFFSKNDPPSRWAQFHRQYKRWRHLQYVVMYVLRAWVFWQIQNFDLVIVTTSRDILTKWRIFTLTLISRERIELGRRKLSSGMSSPIPKSR